MEEKLKDYQRLVCSLCTKQDECDKEDIKIYEYQNNLSIKCYKYDYKNKSL